ncbi:nitronate monooxygenase family protein [Mollicutes bacterium LVI A0039]|nr:nitronate monooxygenase family protein [Mollicutes bacterium LVI A0039]
MNKSFTIRNKKIPMPIVQGGMGVGVSRSGLASAVINCGGVGTISASQIGFTEPDFNRGPKQAHEANVRALKKEVAKVRDLSSGFLAVNILTASRQYAGLAKAAVEAGADAIVSGAGLPLDMPAYTADSDTANIPIVSSSRALNLICKRWLKRYGVKPDAVVVEGPMAGGHLGVKYEELDNHKMEDNLDKRFLDVKEYCAKNELDIPIIVAGGIFNRSDAKKYFDLGATAIQVGTRFIGTHECDADIDFKQKFIDSTDESVRYVKSPVGYPARALSNDMTKELDQGHIPVNKCLGCVITCAGKSPSTPYCITEKLIDAVKGDTTNGLVFTGANGYRISKIESVSSVINDLLGREN